VVVSDEYGGRGRQWVWWWLWLMRKEGADDGGCGLEGLDDGVNSGERNR